MRLAGGAAVLLALFLSTGLAARAAEHGAVDNAREPGADKPQAVISADEVAYDESLGAVIATGHVEIVHGDRILLADSVRYDQVNDSVVATGNVTILEPTGEVLFADYVELSDELRGGVIENIRIMLADNSRFAANGARRVDGRRTIMKRAAYSPCDLCDAEPDKPPLWQIKAGTITHDQEARTVSYTNAWLELAGIPIAYTPYLTHPDPTVDRRSGLLAPTFGTSTPFGGFARAPVFWAITPSIDATVEPIFAIKERPILALEYRQRFNSGEIEFSGSATKADRESGPVASPIVEDDVFRGHLFGTGRFDISDDWRWGFDFGRATDRTYLDRYEFFGEPEDTLESNLFVERFGGRSYASGNIFGYQDLTTTSISEDPVILPALDYNAVSEADAIGGRWSFDANLRSTLRDAGPNTRRLSLAAGYMIPFVADFGLVTTVSASAQADGYHMDKVDVGGSPENNILAGRVVPRLAVEWRYPFVRGTGGIRQIIEPVVAVIATPSAGNPSSIQDEDSTVIELDDTNLLSEDRIPGIDRADTGQRVVYGLKGGLYGERGGRLTVFVGQSYRRPDDDPAFTGADIEQGSSDYVGRLDIAPREYFDLLYRFRVSEANADLLRSELGAIIGPPAFRLQGDYIFVASEASAGVFPDREEVSAELTSKLTDSWSIAGNMRRDLTSDGGPLEYGGGITYEDECFRFTTKFRRDFTTSVDVEESSVYSVELMFKSLGDVSARKSTSN